MTIEAFVFLGIVLLVWMIANVGSWLRQQIEHYLRLQETAAVNVVPSEDVRPVYPDAVALEPQERAPSPVGLPEEPKRPFLCRSRRAARQGIILMTVFGPCKALDPRDES